MLSGLCSYSDVVGQADVSLASASTDAEEITEVIENGIKQGHADLTMDLVKKIQKIIAPNPTDYYLNTPSTLVNDLLTDEAKVFLNQAAVYYSIRAAYRKGKGTMRFRFQEAGDVVSKETKDWDVLCKEEFASICPLLTFYQTGDRTVITYLERLMMMRQSSIRVTC